MHRAAGTSQPCMYSQHMSAVMATHANTAELMGYAMTMVGFLGATVS